MNEALLLILGAALGWVGQWLFYRYQQRDQQRQGPQVVISKVVRHNQILCELRNVGTDSLSEMDLKISWQQDGQEQQLQLDQFFLPDQDERLVAPTHVQLLGPRDRYIAVGLPQRTDDGIIDVIVEGLGVASQRIYTAKTQIDVPLQKPSV